MTHAIGLPDQELLDRVQRHTLRFFWDFAHPVSGLARDRTNPTPRDPDNDWITIGGSGFGVMAILAGIERGWLGRGEALDRILVMLRFLEYADHYHGVFPHFLHGGTGRAIRFSRKDDGADLVETAFLIMGLFCARQYFDREEPAERELRGRVASLWHDIEWSWHTQGGRPVLYWHWSPNHGWSMDHEIRGWNECLVTYVLAAGAERYPIDARPYHHGWTQCRDFRNARTYHGITLPLGPELGGPLFFAHYSFMGLDPRGLRDAYADYAEQVRAHCLVNRAHCIANPHGHAGYGPDCWGLTASDSPAGYDAHSPTNDLGVISPTAALASMPFVPDESMAALRHFHDTLGDWIWRDLGFVDAFRVADRWQSGTHLAIDQGPIVVMIENHRSGLLWRLFMSCPEVRRGLHRLGFAIPNPPVA